MRIFVSYSHQDEAWKKKVWAHLDVLASEGLDVWEDRQIGGGDNWLPAITQAIARCDVALLLISANFLTSRFILDKEVSALLKRREKQGVRVIPVILSACAWTRVSWLKSIQARPKDGKPLATMGKAKADAALQALTEELDDLARKRPGRKSRGKLPPERIDITHLPLGTDHFLGREAELATLDAAWKSAGKTALVELIAPGGTGKTAFGNGVEMSTPVALLGEPFASATPASLADLRIEGGGYDLYWPSLDEGIFLPDMCADVTYGRLAA